MVDPRNEIGDHKSVICSICNDLISIGRHQIHQQGCIRQNAPKKNLQWFADFKWDEATYGYY